MTTPATPLRCIIVEDEPLAAEILAEYIGMTPTLTLTHVCADAVRALDVLNNHPVDLVFLDINLPKLSGIDFLKSFQKPPKVIITTAYHEFAVEGFELRVVDYLLKPVEFDRFTKAVQKALSRTSGTADVASAVPPERPYYFFNVSKRAVKIYLDEIQYIESLKDSVAIHLTTGICHHTHYQLGQLEALMPADLFLRIHRSFLVAIDKIRAHSSTTVDIGGISLPIGRSHKQEVVERLNNHH